MKYLLILEEAAQLGLAIAGLYLQPLHIPGWLWPLVFLSPDIGMIGYLFNPAVGAMTYNLTHHKGIAIVLAAAGWWLVSPVAAFIGVLIYAHSSFDRMMGYGLKYSDAFRHTHLGWLPEGRKRKTS